MEEIELVNGNWAQTTASILFNINKKLSTIDVNNIITSIDENTKSDINILRSDIGVISSDIGTINVDNDIIKTGVTNILNRVNSISVVKEVKTILKPSNKERKPFKSRIQYIKQPEVHIHTIIYIMDMELRQGYSVSYRIDLQPGVHTFDTRLSWLISGDRRRLLWSGTLTDDIILIYNKLGITDLNIIKKSRLG
jgi:hypothetical protein